MSLNLALRATPRYPEEKSPKTFPGKGTRRCVRFEFALVMTMTTSHVGPPSPRTLLKYTSARKCVIPKLRRLARRPELKVSKGR